MTVFDVLFRAPEPPWRFWDPHSGLLGGMVMGSVINVALFSAGLLLT